MLTDRSLVENRLYRTLEQRIRPHIYGATAALDIQVWHVPGEPVPVEDALAATYTKAAVGDTWGPPWGTSWFRFHGSVPADWDGKPAEAVIDLGFGGGPGFSAEGLAYTPEGEPIKGLSPRNMYVPLGGISSGGLSSDTAARARGGAAIDFYVEAASNPNILDRFQPTQLGDVETAPDEPLFEVRKADLALVNQEVWQLVLDLEVAAGLANELEESLPRKWELLTAIDRTLDAVDLDDVPGSAATARAVLAPVLAKPAYASAHHVHAVGHAHIDSAWLWPLRETVRKVARTVSNVTALAADNPGFVFAFSSAQQHAWMKEHHPKVWRRLKDAVAAGQIIPVGSMWVESDTNMPGSEAMARQFTYGKRFFLDEYGIDTPEVWLPDSFGYSPGLPQIVKLTGTKWFLTQKISWNQTNKFPHHTFWWEGIDGTRVFTHFPSADTYNGMVTAKELVYAQQNYQDKGGGTRSLLPFGYGDGGGGPTREMLGNAERFADLEGAPTVQVEPPVKFFEAAHEEYADAPVWRGELYLELHRATYTSQAKTKQGNRRSESLLREAEIWSTAALLAGVADYPYDELDRIWKAVLLNQFHDILPGSSIHWVHREAEATYAKLAVELESLIAAAQQALAGQGSQPIVFNAAPHARDGVAALGAGTPAPGSAVSVSAGSAGYVLDNGLVTAVVDPCGLLTSVVDQAAGREVLAGPANLLQLHVDTPNMWDAWDVDKFYRNVVTDLTDVDSITEADGVLTITRSFGSSTVQQKVSLPAGAKRVDVETRVDWHEKEKFLKVSFPLAIAAERSAAETQFGHHFRPTHTNTSWETAKFEICAHRFLHVEEPGYGAAVVNDSTYGHDVSRHADEDGNISTTVRLSLLRAPLCPDPVTDQGEHVLRYALVVGADVADAAAEGFRINQPARTVTGAKGVEPAVTVDDPAVIVSAVKPADDRTGDIVVRVYESRGGRASARVVPGFEATSVVETDLLERETAKRDLTGGGVELALRPFEIVTLRFTR